MFCRCSWLVLASFVWGVLLCVYLLLRVVQVVGARFGLKWVGVGSCGFSEDIDCVDHASGDEHCVCCVCFVDECDDCYPVLAVFDEVADCP